MFHFYLLFIYLELNELPNCLALSGKRFLKKTDFDEF